MSEEIARFTASGAADLEKFTDMIEKLLNATWGPDWGTFSEEYPTGNTPEKNPMPHITYNLVLRKKTPGRSLKTTQFESVPDPEHEGETITTNREWFDCEIEFTVFGRTNRESRKVAEEFEALIDQCKGFLKNEGVSEILFDEEAAAGLGGSSRQGLPQRILRYKVRIERITLKRSYALKQIGLKLQAVDVDVTVENEGYSVSPGVPQAGLSHISKTGSSDFLSIYEQNFPKQKEEKQ